jgi:uncharacterized membrane protein (UPF0127 family)
MTGLGFVIAAGPAAGAVGRLWRAALVGLALLAPPTAGHAQPAAATAEGPLEPLAITTSSGPHKFTVEVMRTDAERERGLMFRRYMPPDRGMLFDFKTEQPVLMWMKNTYIPLDMIFMNRAGKVVSIARNAEPLSERIIPSGVPAYAVLEVNAGTAAGIGVKVGDVVRNALFKN